MVLVCEVHPTVALLPLTRVLFSEFKVLIVMTDGISGDSVVRPSRDLRNAGVRILALGIGRKFRRSQLNQMAMNRRYVFNAGFKNLNRVVRSIKRTACGGNWIEVATLISPLTKG